MKPYPKSGQLSRKERRYRRKIASAKQWQALQADKQGPCRVCGGYATTMARNELHHLVSRAGLGDDTADNLVPLCCNCHDAVTRRDATASRTLLESLTDAEYAYAIDKGGQGFFERAYGLTYSRGAA